MSPKRRDHASSKQTLFMPSQQEGALASLGFKAGPADVVTLCRLSDESSSNTPGPYGFGSRLPDDPRKSPFIQSAVQCSSRPS